MWRYYYMTILTYHISLYLSFGPALSYVVCDAILVRRSEAVNALAGGGVSAGRQQGDPIPLAVCANFNRPQLRTRGPPRADCHKAPPEHGLT